MILLSLLFVCLPSKEYQSPWSWDFDVSKHLTHAWHKEVFVNEWMNKWGSPVAQTGIQIKRHLCVLSPQSDYCTPESWNVSKNPMLGERKAEVLKAAGGGREFSSSNFPDYVVGETGEGAKAITDMMVRATPWSEPGLLPPVYLLPLCQDLRRWTWRSLHSFICLPFWCGYINKSFVFYLHY